MGGESMGRDAERRMRVESRSLLADGVAGLELVPAEGEADLPGWEPGSHVELVRDHDLARQYSLCGRTDEPGWRIAVLLLEDGRGGSAWVHDDLKPGSEVTVLGPRNHFELQPAPDFQFIAGGIGITPILPMLRECERRGDTWRLAYGGRSRGSMAFLDELEAYADKVAVLPQDQAGLLDLEALLGDEVEGRRVYCCGPEPLLDAIEVVMKARPGEELHIERFAPRGDLDTSGDAFEVEIASSGRRVPVGEGQSIIDALRDEGVDVDFSCREGTCGTCETGVLGGVPDHRDVVLDDDEKAAGDCMMICVGRCKEGPLVLDL